MHMTILSEVKTKNIVPAPPRLTPPTLPAKLPFWSEQKKRGSYAELFKNKQEKKAPMQ